MSRFLRPTSLHLNASRANPKLSYVHGSFSKPLLYQTVGETLQKAVAARTDHEFLVFRQQGIRKTFSQLEKDARKLAAGFFAMGLRPGDRVAIWSHNYYEWVVVQMANAISGLIQVNVNPGYKSRELHYALKTVGVKALITPAKYKQNDYIRTITEIAPMMAQSKLGVGAFKDRNLPDLEHVVVFGNEQPVKGAWNFTDIWNSADSIHLKKLEAAEAAVDPDDPVNIQYTSGTTGFPKAATLTHHGVVNNAYFVGLRSEFDKKKEIICIPPPLYHCYGSIVGIMNALIHQQTCVFPSISYNVEESLKAIHEEKCTTIFGTPTMFIDLLASPVLNKYDMSSVRGAYIGAAPTPVKLCQSMQKHLNVEDLYQMYGSTELSPLVAMSIPDQPMMKRLKNVGFVNPHTEIKIVDEKGKCVPRGEKGELLARGYCVMRSYWGDENRTKKEITPDRWYHTGDTAIMNEDGSISIVGRTKDMICRGGENIYPTEIEHNLFKLPYISDAQVIGVPDKRLGEEVCAWVRLKSGFEVNEQRIREDCKELMVNCKVPKYVLIKEEKDFPLTATGKVKKYEMRAISKKLLGLEQMEEHFNS